MSQSIPYCPLSHMSQNAPPKPGLHVQCPSSPAVPLALHSDRELWLESQSSPNHPPEHREQNSP
eukprot:1501878-Rhodomonas_salina.4